MVTCHPATPDRWDDVAEVMGTRGDPARCWCQYFRLRGREWAQARTPDNRKALRHQVSSDPIPPGVLAYRDGEPAGWCAVGPKAAYPRLLASRMSSDPAQVQPDDTIWAISCFVVRVPHRRQGVATALLDAAVELAREHGAGVVEAYPVDVAVRETPSSSELFHGTLEQFQAAGFVVSDRPAPTRLRVRRALRAKR